MMTVFIVALVCIGEGFGFNLMVVGDGPVGWCGSP